MRCSGCGKDIPFDGQVCPFCQRDKSGDQMYMVAAWVLGLAFGAMGYFLFDFWGAIGGFFVGAVIAASVVYSHQKSAPPTVRVEQPTPAQPVQEAAATSQDVGSKLKELKALHEAGLISDDEYSQKRRDVLAKF